MGTPPGSKFPIPRVIMHGLAVFVAFGAIVTFVYMFGVGICATWNAENGIPPTFNEPFLYIATTLSGLVGGLVAVGFGQKTPEVVRNAAQISLPSPLDKSLMGLGTQIIPPVSLIARVVLASIYALVYFAFGFIAIYIWFMKSAETPDLIKNLATTFIGMLLPIIAAFFSGEM